MAIDTPMRHAVTIVSSRVNEAVVTARLMANDVWRGSRSSAPQSQTGLSRSSALASCVWGVGLVHAAVADV